MIADVVLGSVPYVVLLVLVACVVYALRRRPGFPRLLLRWLRSAAVRLALLGEGPRPATLRDLQMRVWDEWVLTAERSWEGSVILPEELTVAMCPDDESRFRTHLGVVECELSLRARRLAARRGWRFDPPLHLEVESSVLCLPGLPEAVEARYRPAGVREETSLSTEVLTERAVALARRGETLIVAGRMVLGRDPGCDLPVTDERVSRRHAQLEVQQDTLTVRDLGSKNGTYVNGQRIRSRAVTVGRGDRIRFADGDDFRVVAAGGTAAGSEEAPTTSGTGT